MIKIYMLLLVLGVIGGVGYGAFYYYKDTQARIAILTENSAKLEQAASTQKQTIETLVADAAKFQELNRELNTKLESANDYKNTLIDKLRKHNLAALSLKKPGLVERKINNGTKKLFESLEKLSAVEPDPSSTTPK
jgi:hypothetical protein